MLMKIRILFGSLFSFKTYTISLSQRDSPCANMYVMGESRTCCNCLSLEVFLLSMSNSLLRSIRRLAKTGMGDTLLPASSACC